MSDAYALCVSMSQLINAVRHYAIISYPGHMTIIHVIHSLTLYASAISVTCVNEMPRGKRVRSCCKGDEVGLWVDV